MERVQNNNKLPSFRFNIADINLSTIPDQQPSLFSRNQIERQLQLTDLSTINHNDSESVSDQRVRSKSPHSIERKRPPITNLSNFLKLNPKTRLQLQPPPNDYATFKRDHQKVDLQLEQRQSQISIHSKAKSELKRHIERAADYLLEELIEMVGKEGQTPKKSKIVKSRPITPKKGKQNFSKLFEKSREELQLQMKIRQLDKALKKTKKDNLTDQQKFIIKLINQNNLQELTRLANAQRLNFNFCQPYGQKNTPLIMAINAANTQQKSLQDQLTLENSRSYKIVDFLIKHGADVNLPDCKGRTPLLMACHWNHPVLVGLLLENKADVNRATLEAPFINPLFSCLFKKKFNMALMLIQAGADFQKPKSLQNQNKQLHDEVHSLDQSSYRWLERCQNKLKGAQWLQSVREKSGSWLGEHLQRELLCEFL